MEIMKKNAILDEFQRIEDDVSWDSWYEFENHYFTELLDAPSKEQEDLDRQDRRQPLDINGVRWMPVASSQAVNKDIEFWHWKLTAKVFARLEPEAAAENAAHPERYNRFCVYCEIRTGEMSLITCPICEHELLDLPLNDMDD